MILAGEALTGMPRAALDARGEFYPNAKDVRTGKSLIWCDPLYPLEMTDDTPDAAIARSEAALSVLDAQQTLECRYAAALFEVVREKARLVRDLRARYVAGDRAWLREMAFVGVPRILQKYDRLMKLHRALWERDMKRFGWEVLCLRYGAVMGRLADVQDELRRYLAGTLSCIPELDEAPLCARRGPQTYLNLVSPSRDSW